MKIVFSVSPPQIQQPTLSILLVLVQVLFPKDGDASKKMMKYMNLLILTPLAQEY